ncbi:sugar transferase [Candidatus Peregrinibacteria bacterium]|nr:sugar transferase [Candidatus Peregrinibacteria bacterium]MBT7736738.1 sugar transferase [Candidatus Peregrinibacteria bacterium]
MKRFEIFFGIVKVPIDFIMTVIAFMAAYQLRLLTDQVEGIAKAIDYSVLPTIKEYIYFSVGAAIVFIVIATIGKSYKIKSTFKFSKELRSLFLTWLVWMMAVVTYFFFTRTFPFSRLAMIYSWGLTLILLGLGRALLRIIQNALLKSGIGRRRLIFIGNNNITEELNKMLQKDQSYKIIGIIGDTVKSSPIKHLGKISQLEYLLKKHKVDEIIQTKSDTSSTQNEEIVELCELKHINYKFVPDLIEVRRTNIDIETVGSIPIISLKPTPLDGWGKVAKRLTDVAGALAGMVLLSPILLTAAIAVKIDSKGPILFTKLDNGEDVKRVGEYGKLFKFYKFRSMHPNTNSLRYKELSKKNTRKEGPLVKIKNDPRVTNVGRFIRKYSIDELPQLWNVLIGNMSLVGPRPHLPEEVAEYKKHHRFVLTIKPGLTGLPQTSGRSDLNFEEEVKLDRFYIENWSILLDLKLIFKTIGVILKGHDE